MQVVGFKWKISRQTKGTGLESRHFAAARCITEHMPSEINLVDSKEWRPVQLHQHHPQPQVGPDQTAGQSLD
jgi:hypothetical protein